MIWNIMKREDLEAVKTVMKSSVKGRKGKGRTKKKWLKAIECDMRTADVCVNDVVED